MIRLCWTVAVLFAAYAGLYLFLFSFGTDRNAAQMAAYSVYSMAIAVIPFVIVLAITKLVEAVEKAPPPRQPKPMTLAELEEAADKLREKAALSGKQPQSPQ